MSNHLTDRLNDAFDKRVGGTVILPSSDLLSAITCIEQQAKERDELLSILDELTDVFGNIGMTAGIYDDEQDVLKRACDLIYRMKGN